MTKTLWALLILYILLNPLTASGSNFQNYLKSNYSDNGTVTTYTPADLQAASWIRENGASQPIVITDPMTLQVLTGLGVEGYSLVARTNISSPASQQIAVAYTNLTKSLMSSFSNSKLNSILLAYASYDFSVSGASGYHRAFLIVNWRTSLWLRGLNPTLIKPFQPFSGFAKLMNADSLSQSFIPSENYIVFTFNP